MTALFFGYVGLMAVGVVAASARYLGVRLAAVTGGALVAWLLYIGGIGYWGVVRNVTMRPPGSIFLLFPVVALLAFLIIRISSSTGLRVAQAFPLWMLLGIQVFRVGVEFFLHQIWLAGLIPKMLTFSGANVDIYIGASAPVIAWLSSRGRLGLRVALIWNFLGLLSLANVVTRAVLTTPGPLGLIHTEVPDLMIGTFPFMFIPGFFVPLAVTLHVLAIRAIHTSFPEPAVFAERLGQ